MGAIIPIDAALDSPALFGPWFAGESWDSWRAILRGAFALPMTEADVATFRELAERDPPTGRVRELWIIAGRRAGKDSIASAIATHTAVLVDHRPRLRPGERATVLCLAVDRAQAKIVLNYTKGYFEQIPAFRKLITRETADGFDLKDRGTEVVIATNDFRAVRGRSVALAVFDECAFWRSEESTAPDEETYRAVLPGMATFPGAMLVGISSPYRKAGLLYDKFKRHYGKDDSNILVVKAPSRRLNPTLPQSIVDAALAQDPESAAAEWLGEFRNDIAAYITREQVDACVQWGCTERAPNRQVVKRYRGFLDAAAGNGSDSMTLAIAHREGETGVLDLLREWRPPFSPDDVTDEAASLLRSYGIVTICADRWGGDWVAQAFSKRWIKVEYSGKPKSDLYKELLPLIMTRRCSLLDQPRLLAQLCTLERRTARGGRDSIDHTQGQHDDCINGACGALVNVALTPGAISISPEALALSRKVDLRSGPGLFRSTRR